MDKRESMGKTTIQVDDERAETLHSLKNRGDSYDDVLRRVLPQVGGADVPGERRVVCDVCGWDGGTYSFTTTEEPEYCPGCGREIDGDSTRAVAPAREPTALTFKGDEIDHDQ